ncbi:MAG: type IV toxin-antitoxin system AbiEi family antitoxin domain-containing protein, partial [Frankiaceae bacterium]
IRERFRRQNGFVTRQQLLALGLTAKAVDGRLRSGRYVAFHSGVYSEGVAREDPIGRASAAVLACGDGAALSHASAASLWGFLPRWGFPLEVTTKVRRTRRASSPIVARR